MLFAKPISPGLGLILISVLSLSCSSLGKSAIRREAEDRAQKWWENVIAKCGDEYYVRYEGGQVGAIYFDKFGSESKNAILQFKNASYQVIDEPISEADRLNGIEWKGALLIPFNTLYRAYDLDRKQWSSWSEGPVIYSDKVLKAFNQIMGDTNSPQTQHFSREKGQWFGLDLSAGRLRKPTCSEIPR